MANNYQLETLAVREGQERSQFNEHSEALYLTSSYVFDSAAQAAARFSGGEEGNVYSRFTNPTVATFQSRLAALEGAESCVATASGMSAILSLIMALCSAGDHIVASTGLFGATQQMLGNIMARFGVHTTFVSQTRTVDWDAAIRPETKLFFLETPSNPLTEIADIATLVALAHTRGVLVVVDKQDPEQFVSQVSVFRGQVTRAVDASARERGSFQASPSHGQSESRRFLTTSANSAFAPQSCGLGTNGAAPT